MSALLTPLGRLGAREPFAAGSPTVISVFADRLGLVAATGSTSIRRSPAS